MLAAVDEEGTATGVKNLVQKKMGVDYAIFGEPSGIKKVTIAYKGRLAINLKVVLKIALMQVHHGFQKMQLMNQWFL